MLRTATVAVTGFSKVPRSVSGSSSAIRAFLASSAAGAPLAQRRWRSSSADGGDATQVDKRRLWRWGGASGFMGKEEVSKDPLLFEDFRGITTAACGSSHSAFVVGGKLYTYGANKYSQLGRSLAEGDASNDPEEVPFPEGAAEVAKVSMGACHSAAITSDGALWTWGWGGSFLSGVGALGNGSKDTVKTPARIEQFINSGERIAQVACGGQHTLVLTEDGRLYSTGQGEFGRLGHGDTRDEVEFREVDYWYEAHDSVIDPDKVPTLIKIGAGNNFSAALSEDGELWVWGRNDHGQLGLGEEAMGDMYSAERYPRLVRGLEGLRIVDFACGEYQIVVYTDQGTFYEWGGRTWLEPHQVPVPEEQTEAMKAIVKLVAGEKFCFALAKDGTLFTWGSKASGCLALGEECAKMIVEPTAVPASAFGRQPIVDVFAAGARCLAVTVEDGYKD